MKLKPILLILILLMTGCVQFDFDEGALETSIFGEPLSNRVDGHDHDVHNYDEHAHDNRDHAHEEAAETAVSAIQVALSALVSGAWKCGQRPTVLPSWKFAQDITMTSLF